MASAATGSPCVIKVFLGANPGYLNVSSTRAIALCGDGRMLRVLETEIDGKIHDESAIAALFGVGLHALGTYA